MHTPDAHPTRRRVCPIILGTSTAVAEWLNTTAKKTGNETSNTEGSAVNNDKVLDQDQFDVVLIDDAGDPSV